MDAGVSETNGKGGGEMAWTKSTIGSRILRLLHQRGIEVEPDEAKDLEKKGYARICGFYCKAANVLTIRSFRVIVCTDWFRRASEAKPRISTSKIEFDYQLFPTRRYLFALTVFIAGVNDFPCFGNINGGKKTKKGPEKNNCRRSKHLHSYLHDG